MCTCEDLFLCSYRHGRKFQFFCKYYLAMCASLCGCVILSKDVPVIREWSPLYVMITVIVVMSEKVDTTITKGKSSGAVRCCSSVATALMPMFQLFAVSYTASARWIISALAW